MFHATPATRGARPTKGSKEEVNITRISFCAVDVSLVGAFVMLTKIEKAGLNLGQEEIRGQHRISLSNVAKETAYLLILQLVFNTSYKSINMSYGESCDMDI